jgi:hypothetical protein
MDATIFSSGCFLLGMYKIPQMFGCNGCVTAVAAGQSQRFYSGVGIFNWYYLSSAPPELPGPGGRPRMTVTDI